MVFLMLTRDVVVVGFGGDEVVVLMFLVFVLCF